VTLVECVPNKIVASRTKEKDGYAAFQFEIPKTTRIKKVIEFSEIPEGTQIDFTIDFAFRSSMLEKLMGYFFNSAFTKMVTAFETRAKDKCVKVA
jgi:coenzyme Q-binding protein COQ10